MLKVKKSFIKFFSRIKSKKWVVIGISFGLILIIGVISFFIFRPKSKVVLNIDPQLSNLNSFTNKLQKNTLVNIHKYDDPNWNNYFSPPTPPKNHDSYSKLFAGSIPGMKYISTHDAIPQNWVTNDLGYMSFRYPSDYQIVVYKNQRILFYMNSENMDLINKCLADNIPLLSEGCPIPVITLYVNSINKNLVEKASISWGAALYGLDGREWYVSTPEDPVKADVGGSTVTDKNIISFVFRKYNKNVFTDEQGLHGFNYRDEIYRIISSIVIKDDTKLANQGYGSSYEVKTYSVTANTDPYLLFNDQSSLFMATGLEYLPEDNKKIEFFQKWNSKSDTYLFSFPIGFFNKGTYVYDDKKYIIDEVDNVASYLADKKYCVQDSDCSYREYFCTKDFFNNYQKRIEQYEGCSTIFDELGNYLSGGYGEEKCVANVKFDSIACVSNKCTGVNYQYSCK